MQAAHAQYLCTSRPVSVSPHIESSSFRPMSLQGLLKHAVPIHLVRGTDLLPLALSNKKMTAANTAIAVPCGEPKLYLFIIRSAENTMHFGVCCRILVISLECHGMEHVANRWSRGCLFPYRDKAPGPRGAQTSEQTSHILCFHGPSRSLVC